jgi:ribosomal protein S8
MSQDTVSDAMNMMMNAKKAGKKRIVVKRVSNLLLKLIEILKEDKMIDFKKEKEGTAIELNEVSTCSAIKPRFNVKVEDIEKYIRRFLPARGVGTIIISTSKGLMKHEDAIKKNMGGSLIAYYY